MRAFQKVRRQLPFREFHPDLGGARPVRVGGGLDPVQASPQSLAKVFNSEIERLSLRCQIQNQLFLVIGKVVLHRRNLGIAGQRGFQIFCGGLQRGDIGAIELHIQRITAGTRAPATEGHHLGQGQLHHALLQLAHKGKARIGAQVRIDQLDGDAAQEVAVLGFSPRKAPARVAAHFGHDKIDRIAAIAFLIFRSQHLDRALKFTHLLQRIGAGGTFDHGKIAGHRCPLRRVEEPPADIALNEQRHLAGQQHKGARHHHVARPDHTHHQWPEQPVPAPAKAPVHHPVWRVIPMPLAGVG